MNQEPIELDDAIMYCTPSSEKAMEIFHRLTNGVREETINPLQLLVRLKFAEQIIKATIDNIREAAVDYASSKYASKEQITMLGAELKMKEAGSKYIFDGCNDPIYNSISAVVKENALKLKDRATFLKAVKKRVSINDEETGEVYEINPPIKTSTTIVEVRIKGMKELFEVPERSEIEGY